MQWQLIQYFSRVRFTFLLNHWLSDHAKKAAAIANELLMNIIKGVYSPHVHGKDSILFRMRLYSAHFYWRQSFYSTILP